MDQTNPLELDEILRQVTQSYSNNRERGRVATVNRQFNDNVTHSRVRRAGAVMGGAMTRYRLTHFPPITSVDQKIRELVPPIWILFTAMSNHATALGRRGEAAEHIGARYGNDEMGNGNYSSINPPPGMTTEKYLRIQSEAYLYVQYKLRPDGTLRQFFQSIADKNGMSGVDVVQFFTPAVGQTAPELLRLTFTDGDLATYGW